MPEITPAYLLFGLIWYGIFIIAITFHEAAHAWAAYLLGDATAYHGGQVTLDPRPHLAREPIGTVIVPILSYLLTGNIWGWASAPYNPHWAYRYPKRALLMSLAGPAANLVLMLIAMAAMRALIQTEVIPVEDVFEGFWPGGVLSLFQEEPSSPMLRLYGFFLLMAIQNLFLMVFNLIPVPPLDGSAIWVVVLPWRKFEQYLFYASQAQFQLLGIIAASGLMSNVLMRPMMRTFYRMLFWGL